MDGDGPKTGARVEAGTRVGDDRGAGRQPGVQSSSWVRYRDAGGTGNGSVQTDLGHGSFISRC